MAASVSGVGRHPTQSGSWLFGKADIQERLDSPAWAAFRTCLVEGEVGFLFIRTSLQFFSGVVVRQCHP